MKAILTLIRAVFIVTATFVFLFGAKAEIFIGSSTNVNSLVIASNEVILISAARIATIYVEMSIAGKINLKGTMQSLGMDSFCEKPLALAGPATLSFPADSG